MRAIIEQLTAPNRAQPQLLGDPLDLALSEGYTVSLDAACAIVGLQGNTLSELVDDLARHMARFQNGKWYEVEPESASGADLTS